MGVLPEPAESEPKEAVPHMSEADYRSLFEDSPIAMWEEDQSAVKACVDEFVASGVEDVAEYLLTHPDDYERCARKTRILAVNRAAVELYDAASQKDLIERGREIDLQLDKRQICRFWAAMVAGLTSATYEDSCFTLGGRPVWVRETCLVAPGHEEAWDRVYIVNIDISDRVRAEAAQSRLNRLLRTVSAINQMMIRALDRQTLLAPACKTFVDLGGFRMACIAFCNPETMTLEPIAWAGAEASYFENVTGRYDEHPEGRGPGGTAAYTGRAVVCRDVENEESVGIFRKAAIHCGYRSLAAVPIRGDGQVRGVLGVFAVEPNAFDTEEVDLLQELADDLGFALMALEHAAARESAEAALRASEARYRRIVETAAEGIAVLDTERRMTFVNEKLCQLLGHQPEELVGLALDALLFSEDVPTLDERWMERAAGQVGRVELQLRHKDGSPRWVLVSSQPVLDESGRFAGALSMITDIHDRKLAEKRSHRTLERLRYSVDAAVNTLARTIEMRDPYTAGHQQRVTELSLAIGKRLGLAPRTMTSLRIASLIHDLGKISVPAEILAKPGILTKMEWQLIRQHPETGCQILREMRFPGPVATIVHQHHERLDGSGYPQGLVDGDIRLEARILAVADVVEAMASHRPYRAALGVDVALREIETKRDTLYDPKVVDACLALFRDEGFAFSTAA